MKFPLSKCCAICEAEEEFRRAPVQPFVDPELATARRAAYEEHRKKCATDYEQAYPQNNAKALDTDGHETSTRRV